MNIFLLDLHPYYCAIMHVDKHVIKMILETCQLLCSAVHICGNYEPCYKLTHKNHPCSIWTRQSIENYKWLCQLGKALCSEYTYRYGKTHKCQQYIEDLEENPPDLPSIGFTKPAMAMPDEYKHQDPVLAYRKYYANDKKNLHSWKGKIQGRQIPVWLLLNKC